MHAHAFSVFTKPYETWSYWYAECFSALHHDKKNHFVFICENIDIEQFASRYQQF